MVSVGGLLDSVKVLLVAINWATTSFSEKATSTRFSSTEAKSGFSYAELLELWNHYCVGFKRYSILNF